MPIKFYIHLLISIADLSVTNEMVFYDRFTSTVGFKNLIKSKKKMNFANDDAVF